MKVYLAAPHMDDEFRESATHILAPLGVEVLDPIKARDFRGKEIGNEDEIVDGDLADVLACNCILGNYSVPGWGTACETWFAYGIGRPVIAYVAPEARVSPWVARMAGGYENVFRLLTQACSAVLELLPRDA